MHVAGTDNHIVWHDSKLSTLLTVSKYSFVPPIALLD